MDRPSVFGTKMQVALPLVVGVIVTLAMILFVFPYVAKIERGTYAVEIDRASH